MRINCKKIIVALSVVLLGTLSVQAQTVKGTVLDSDGFPLPDVEVAVKGATETTVTDVNGNFEFTVPAGSGVLEVFAPSGKQVLSYNVNAGATQDLGDFILAPTLNEVVAVGRGVIDVEEGRKTPVAVNTVFRDEIQEKAQGNVEFPEVLSNTPSVYVSNQSGGFGDSQMFTRGYDQTNTAFLLNGQPINGMEDGRMYWSNWSGMTEIANAVQIQRGLGSSKLAISSVGGTINIITKATEKKKGGYVQGVVGNDSYFKLGAGYNTGLSGKWGLSFALSHWQGYRKWAEGTKGQGQNYFLSVGFKPNDKHNFNLLITGAPQWHDQNFTKPKSAYEAYGNKYNSNYGFLDGEYTSWRRNYYHKPIFNLNWDFNINEKMNLSSVMYASVGRGGGTGNYGRTNLSSGIIDATSGHANFDAVYAQNIARGTTIGGIDNVGQYGTNSTGTGAIRSSVNNHFWWGNVTNFNMQVNENFSFNVGADYRSYHGDHFREFVNLLGLAGWNDPNLNRPSDYVVTETFEANPWKALTNFASKDQRINYDYSEDINYLGGFGQAEYATDKFSVFVQGSVSSQNYQREDRWNGNGVINYNNATTSVAESTTLPTQSEKIVKGGYNIKGGLAYNFNESNTIFGNAGLYSRQPFLDNIFSGARQIYDSSGNFIRSVTDNTALRTPEVGNEEITGLELGYRYNSSSLQVNVNLYHTSWENRFLDVYSRNDTEYLATVDYLMSGVSQNHKGFEIDATIRATSKWNITTYFTVGNWEYDGKSTYDVRRESDFSYLAQNLEADLSNVHIGYSPQVSYGLGSSYKFTQGLSMDFNLNYYGRQYGNINVLGIIQANQNNTQYEAEQITPYAVMNAGLTYKLKLGSQNVKFRGNVYNLFNSSYISQADSFGYALGQGRTWNIGLTANF